MPPQKLTSQGTPGVPRGSMEGLLSALCSDDFPAQGKWLVVSANLNVQGASLVHHLHGWTQRQVDNAWAQLKKPYVVSRRFGKAVSLRFFRLLQARLRR
jgi:hypothetical protein